MTPTLFGYCPKCGARGISSSPKGVVCQRGHVYFQTSDPVTDKFNISDLDDIPNQAEYEDEIDIDNELPNIDIPIRENVIDRIANLME